VTALRQRMIEDLQLRGLSENTQMVYVRVVRQLAEHYGKSPDRISEEEVRQYFLYLKNDKQLAPNSLGVARAGIKFLFVHTLGREWRTLDLVRPSREKKVACGAQRCRSAHDTGAYSSATLSGLLEYHLCLRTACVRRG
jgi:integrase/recombinase XerD